MLDVNGIPGKAPDSADRKPSFEITIRCNDPYYLEAGGPAERVLSLDGYLLVGFESEDKTHLAARGKLSTGVIADRLLELPNNLGRKILNTMLARVIGKSIAEELKLPGGHQAEK